MKSGENLWSTKAGFHIGYFIWLLQATIGALLIIFAIQGLAWSPVLAYPLNAPREEAKHSGLIEEPRDVLNVEHGSAHQIQEVTLEKKYRVSRGKKTPTLRSAFLVDLRSNTNILQVKRNTTLNLDALDNIPLSLKTMWRGNPIAVRFTLNSRRVFTDKKSPFFITPEMSGQVKSWRLPAPGIHHLVMEATSRLGRNGLRRSRLNRKSYTFILNVLAKNPSNQTPLPTVTTSVPTTTYAPTVMTPMVGTPTPIIAFTATSDSSKSSPSTAFTLLTPLKTAT